MGCFSVVELLENKHIASVEYQTVQPLECLNILCLDRSTGLELVRKEDFEVGVAISEDMQC